MSVVDYRTSTAVTSGRPSPKIWADCPVLQFIADPAKGIHIFEDFHYLNCDDADNVLGHFWNLQVTNSALALVSNVKGVAQILHSNGADNDYGCLSTGDNKTGIFNTPKKGEYKKFWFEVRFRLSSVTDDDLATFIGFAEKNKSGQTGLIADSSASLQDVDYLGFYVDDGDGDDLTIVWNEASAGTAQSNTGQITLAAATWKQVGFRLDVDSDYIRVYDNGVDLGDDYAINVDSTNFPSDTDMAIYLVSKAMGGVAATDYMQIDWVRFAQEY